MGCRALIIAIGSCYSRAGVHLSPLITSRIGGHTTIPIAVLTLAPALRRLAILLSQPCWAGSVRRARLYFPTVRPWLGLRVTCPYCRCFIYFPPGAHEGGMFVFTARFDRARPRVFLRSARLCPFTVRHHFLTRSQVELPLDLRVVDALR